MGAVEKAVDYCRRAGDQAMDQACFMAAARFYAMALVGTDLGAAQEPLRCDLLLKAAAAHSAAGELDEAAEALQRAADLAERQGDANRFAQAALGRARFPFFASGGPDGEYVALVTRALDMVGERDALLRVRLLLRIAGELAWQEETRARSRGMEREAELIARRTGCPAAEFAVLVHRHLFINCTPENIDAQLADDKKMLEAALRGGRQEECAAALAFRYGSILRKGEATLPPPMLALAPACNPVLVGGALKRGYRYYAAILALLEGRFIEGVSLVMHFLGRAPAIGQHSVSTLWPALVLPFRELGRLAEVEPLAAQAMARFPGIPLFRALAMNINWLLGKREQARHDYEQLAARNFQDLGRDIGFLPCVSVLTQVCAGIGDRRRAALLYRLLAPHSAMNTVLGPLVFFGPVAFHLGVLADVMGDFDRAQSHFDAALAACRRLKARAWEAYVQHGWARMLERRGDAASREKAHQLAGHALVTAERLKMAALASRLAELKEPSAREFEDKSVCEPHAAETAFPAPLASGCLKSSANGSGDGTVKNGSLPDQSFDADVASAKGQPPESPVSVSDEWVLAREGDYWTLAFGGKVVRVKHARSLTYIAQLLDSPGKEFYAPTLVSAANGFSPGAGEMSAAVTNAENLQIRPFGHDDSGLILDRRARTAYRRRLQELRSELEEAKSFNDSGRAAKLEEEFSLVTRELARAVGLAGAAPRRFCSASERARINVTNAIRSLLQKLRKEHPELSRYLATTVRTGSLCSFQPDPRFNRRWRVSKSA